MYHSQAAQAASSTKTYQRPPKAVRKISRPPVLSRREETARYGRDLLTKAEHQVCEMATD